MSPRLMFTVFTLRYKIFASILCIFGKLYTKLNPKEHNFLGFSAILQQ